uniref:MADF domain-containing protein n=1 Tax=Glossina austeni TaxID=7395 RepID=A0A1A9ULT2_GLOAU
MHNNTTRKPLVNITSVSTRALINSVRKYEILYNRESNGSKCFNLREKKWEKVALELFPYFTKCNSKLKEQIRIGIRRRWQHVRRHVADTARTMKSVENYTRNKQDTVFTQCEFLLPFINSPNCARLAQRLGLQKNTSVSSALADDDDDILDANLGNSPVIGGDTRSIKFKVDNTHLNEVTSSAPEYQNDMQQTDDNGSNVPEKRDFLISNPRSIKVTDENLYFRNKGNDGVEANNSGDKNGSNSRKFFNFANKNDISFVGDMQSRLTRLNNVEKRRLERLESQADYYNQEADRMFLLSLAPELNNVPSASKIAVKAEIAAVIARALGSGAELFS